MALLKKFHEMNAIASEYHQIYCTFGVHFIETNSVQPGNPEVIVKHSKDKSCLDIGEAGLNYYC